MRGAGQGPVAPFDPCRNGLGRAFEVQDGWRTVPATADGAAA